MPQPHFLPARRRAAPGASRRLAQPGAAAAGRDAAGRGRRHRRVTMERVAAEAGVGKGTVFRRFESREGLMAALLDHRETAWQAAVISGPPPLGPGRRAVGPAAGLRPLPPGDHAAARRPDPGRGAGRHPLLRGVLLRGDARALPARRARGSAATCRCWRWRCSPPSRRRCSTSRSPSRGSRSSGSSTAGSTWPAGSPAGPAGPELTRGRPRAGPGRPRGGPRVGAARTSSRPPAPPTRPR